MEEKYGRCTIMRTMELDVSCRVSLMHCRKTIKKTNDEYEPLKDKCESQEAIVASYNDGHLLLDSQKY